MLLWKKQGTATHTVAALIVRGTGMLGALAQGVECLNKHAQCVSLGIQVVEEQHVRVNGVRRKVVIQGCKWKKDSVIVIFGYLMVWSFDNLSAYSSTSFVLWTVCLKILSTSIVSVTTAIYINVLSIGSVATKTMFFFVAISFFFFAKCFLLLTPLQFPVCVILFKDFSCSLHVVHLSTFHRWSRG